MKNIVLLFFGVSCLTWAGAQPHVALRLRPGEDNPRNSEGDFITLKNNDILFVYTHYTGKSDSDHAPAYLAARRSRNGGRTWTQRDVRIVENEGAMNVMSVSLVRLRNGDIALFYLRKNSETDCIPMMRTSNDEAATWSEPKACIADKKGFFVLNNDRVVRLGDGRLLMPVAQHSDEADSSFRARACIWCYYSDDDGATWHCSAQVPNPAGTVVQEPGVVELTDGAVMMIVRADDGVQHISHSRDKGVTWTPLQAGNIPSPLSPASLARIPSTGELLLVWNDNGDNQLRTPLSAAISKDDGRTWLPVGNIEDDPEGCYCYTAIHFHCRKVLLAYCEGRGPWDLSGTKIVTLPLGAL